MAFEDELKAMRYDTGEGSFQPSTLWASKPLYAMGLSVYHEQQNDDEITTKLFNIAPVGFTDPNPVHVAPDYSDPMILGGGIPTIKTDNSPAWEECK